MLGMICQQDNHLHHPICCWDDQLLMTTGGSSATSSKEESILRAYKLGESRSDVFWRRWRDEYLKQLPIPSLRTSQGSPQVGSVVLIREDNCPRLQWPLGVVEEMKRGRDGVVRTVKVRTKNGILLRPVQRIHNLECK